MKMRKKKIEKFPENKTDARPNETRRKIKEPFEKHFTVLP